MSGTAVEIEQPFGVGRCAFHVTAGRQCRRAALTAGYCAWHRGRVGRVEARCAQCGGEIPPHQGRGAPRRYCSAVCRSARWSHVPVAPDQPFAPSSFDAAMERGRKMYRLGLRGADYPDDGHTVSNADAASYNLGMRHRREFPEAAL